MNEIVRRAEQATRPAADPVAIVNKSREALDELRAFIHAHIDTAIERLQQLRELTDEKVDSAQGNINELIRVATQSLTVASDVHERSIEVETALRKITDRDQR